jgi:hypothetical protein
MVCWLIFPTELGSVPDEIELLGKLPVSTGGDSYGLLYVYRFRVREPHWAAEDGWLVGWTGPYSVEGESGSDGSYTFSKFEKWDASIPLGEQVDIEVLKEFHQQNGDSSP